MDALIDCVLRSTLTTRKDLFPEDCTFVSFETDNEHFVWNAGLQSTARFGYIAYRRRNFQKVKYSDPLVLKVSPANAFMPQFSSLAFYNECFFYARILPFFEAIDPQISLSFPKYYNSLLQYNVHSDETVIVFENLQASGYSPGKRKSFLDHDHLKLMMRKLGEFHAYSYRARQEAPDKFHAMTLCQVETSAYVLKFFSFDVCLSRSYDRLITHPYYGAKVEKLRPIIDEYREIVMSALTGNENNPTHVLCHGDYLGNNVLFKYENEKPVDAKIVDLASWRFASPAIDLALVLYLNADQKMRNENWDNLIDEYHTSLRNTFPLINVPSKDSILAELKISIMNSFLTASHYLPYLMKQDNDHLPGLADLIPEEYRVEFNFAKLPSEFRYELFMKTGGEEATLALVDILKDIIDRGFW